MVISVVASAPAPLFLNIFGAQGEPSKLLPTSNWIIAERAQHDPSENFVSFVLLCDESKTDLLNVSKYEIESVGQISVL